MYTKEQLDTFVAGLRPSLMMQGRDIKVAEATDEKIVVSLSGFCGGCGCSSEYVDGLQEMMTEQFAGTAVEVVKE